MTMQHRGRWLVVAITAALAAALGGGCGGGGSTDSPTTAADGSSARRAEFVARANAICKRERADLPERVAKFEQARNGKAPEPYGTVVHFVLMPTVEEELGFIEELEQPEGEVGIIDEMLFPQETAVNNVAGTPRISIGEAERIFGDASVSLKRYGLADCVVEARALGLDGAASDPEGKGGEE